MREMGERSGEFAMPRTAPRSSTCPLDHSRSRTRALDPVAPLPFSSFYIWDDAMYSPRELVRDINKVRIRGLLRTALHAMHAYADDRALLLRVSPREQRDEFVER